MNNIRVELKKLSLTGRLCYLFMCIEKYLVTCYSERDWVPVAKRCWQWTNIYWNEGRDVYSPVVPEYLFEFDDYKKVNDWVFDGILSEQDYLILRNLFSGITKGCAEDEINQILRLPIDFNDACEGNDFKNADEPTLEVVFRMLQFMSLYNIVYPDISKISHMTVDQKNGWGDFCNSEYLSIIVAT